MGTFLPLLALACPVGMGVMMLWIGPSKKKSADE